MCIEIEIYVYCKRCLKSGKMFKYNYMYNPYAFVDRSGK